jgi:Family of unknown function (DUF5989)
MRSTEKGKEPSEKLDFVRQASEAQPGFMREFWLFLRENKKWWLTPLIAVLLLLGLLVVVGGTAVAPFIYTLF